ncbi:hypothetical protein [Xanthomonas arboricola]|uniref:hypothetical protein n=1 Tax=Xanthomonas arboricola TaxID=56448 RepID=UPI000AE63BE6|nr:hypothetical protein [Xanthomonas arboricola]
MSWTGTIAAVGVLLSVAAALDVSIKRSVKERLGNKLKDATVAGGVFNYRGSVLLDRIFGHGLLSWKAVARYSIISFCSILISYFFAVFTTFEDEALSQIELFPAGFSYLAFVVLLSCLVFAIVGDLLSYSITRIFIRTVDQYKSSVVSIGLIVADIISSLALFFLAFSFARMISYLLVLSLNQSALKAADEYAPDVLLRGLEIIGASSYNPDDVRSSISSAALLIDVSQNPSLKQQLAKHVKAREIPASLKADASNIIYSITLKCPDVKDRLAAASESKDIVRAALDEVNHGKLDKLEWVKVEPQLDDYIAENFTMYKAGKKCNYKNVVVSRYFPASALVSMVGPANSYLAALERTVYDAYSVVSFKLAPYVRFDPGSSMSEYYGSLEAMLQASFLGMFTPEYDKLEVLGKYTSTKQYSSQVVNVPFSPMVASSLTSSVIFLIYVIASVIVFLRNTVFSGLAGPLAAFDLDAAVFTTIALTISLVLLFLQSCFWLLDLLWSLLF